MSILSAVINSKLRVRFSMVLVISGLAAVAMPVLAQKQNSYWNPDALEMAELPLYCRGHFDKKWLTVPGSTYKNCGSGMHHYCAGLVLLNRASKPGSSSKPGYKDLVYGARNEFEYNRPRVPPDCSVAADIRATDTRLRILEMSVKR